MDELNVYARNICIYVIYILLKFYVQKVIKYIDHLLNYIYLLYLILFVIIFVYCNESLRLCSANMFFIYISKTF